MANNKNRIEFAEYNSTINTKLTEAQAIARRKKLSLWWFIDSMFAY